MYMNVTINGKVYQVRDCADIISLYARFVLLRGYDHENTPIRLITITQKLQLIVR